MKGLKEDLSWDGKIKRLSESVFKLPIDYSGYRLYRNYIGGAGGGIVRADGEANTSENLSQRMGKSGRPCVKNILTELWNLRQGGRETDRVRHMASSD